MDRTFNKRSRDGLSVAGIVIRGARWLRGSVIDRELIGREYEPRLEPLRRDLEQVLYSQLTLTALRRENSNTVSAL